MKQPCIVCGDPNCPEWEAFWVMMLKKSLEKSVPMFADTANPVFDGPPKRPKMQVNAEAGE